MYMHIKLSLDILHCPPVKLIIVAAFRWQGTKVFEMKEINEISKTLGGMPVGTLVAIIVLAGFALAAYAIYAVLAASKERRNGG